MIWQGKKRAYFYRTVRQILSSWRLLKGRMLYHRRAVNRQLKSLCRGPRAPKFGPEANFGCVGGAGLEETFRLVMGVESSGNLTYAASVR